MGNVCCVASCSCNVCDGFSKCSLCSGLGTCVEARKPIRAFSCPSYCQPRLKRVKNDESKVSVSITEPTDPQPVQFDPPQLEVMVKEDPNPLTPTSPVEEEAKPGVSPRISTERAMGDSTLPTATPRAWIDNNAGAAQDTKDTTLSDDNKPVATVGKKRPHNVRRKAASAGLQGCVLGTKTGRLKEYYTLGQKLGQGQFGVTFRCVEKGTGKEYACKSIAKRKLKTKGDVEDVRREIQIMHHLSGNPNVIKIKGAYEDAVAVHVVMELCKGGELFDRIVKRGHYSERKAAELARVIVGVVQACHSLGVMHRDLKPENFLFVNDKEDSPLQTIDFGLSMFFKPGDIFDDVVGSPYYVAPEVLDKRYGPEADVWSAGVIIYILLCGAPPFWAETEDDIFEEILNGELDFSADPWPSISESAKDLIKKMLVRNPMKRITAHDVLCHPWIQINGVAPDKPLDPVVLRRLKQFSAMNKIKRMALRIIAEKLSEDEIAGLKEMFKMIDTDNSGQITFEELKAGIKAFGADLDDSELHNLMEAADVDNSGTIDYGEFIAATLHLNKVEREDCIFAAFSYFDRDGSGYITKDELQKACEEFGIEAPQLEEMIQEVDQDHDGRIDYNEFVAMMQNGNVDLGKKGDDGELLAVSNQWRRADGELAGGEDRR